MTQNSVLFIIPGPTYNILSDSFQKKYKYLSHFFTGCIITTSSLVGKTTIGRFNCLSYKYANGIFARLAFSLFCIKKIYAFKKRKIQFDIVVTYDPITTGMLGLICKYVLRSKLIVEINGVYNSSVVWEDAASNISRRLKKMIVPSIIKFVLHRADGIKLLFPGQIDGFAVNCKRKVVSTYFDWINTDLFVKHDEKKEILFAGFPYRIKGVDILIRAFKLVANKHPGWKLKILGYYPDKRELNSEIDGHNQIFYHPPVPASEMPDHIGRCAFLVQPSRTEAMGRVLVEAMAAGKARIGSRVDGIPTVINDGVDGFLVESENIEELAEKMDMLMSDALLRKQIGDASASRAREEFTAKCYLQKTCRFYELVLG